MSATIEAPAIDLAQARESLRELQAEQAEQEARYNAAASVLATTGNIDGLISLDALLVTARKRVELQAEVVAVLAAQQAKADVQREQAATRVQLDNALQECNAIVQRAVEASRLIEECKESIGPIWSTIYQACRLLGMPDPPRKPPPFPYAPFGWQERAESELATLAEYGAANGQSIAR